MRRSRAWSATQDPRPGPPATWMAHRTASREAAWLFSSFQGDDVRREVMDIGIPPLREHVDMPLQWIGDDDLRDRIVSGEAAISAVSPSERDDKGGDVIKISSYGLPRGERDRYSRRRQLRRCRGGPPATEAPAASAGHDHVLNRLRVIPGADPGEVSGNRVALRAVSGSVEIGFPLLGVAHQDIERAWRATIGKRLAVQPGSDGFDVRRTQGELWHTLGGNAVLDDRRNEFSVLIGENQLRTNQVRSRFSAPGVRAMAEAAIALEELLAVRNLFGRGGRTHRIVRSTIAVADSPCRLGRARGGLRRRLRSAHGRGTGDDHNAEQPNTAPRMHRLNPRRSKVRQRAILLDLTHLNVE